MLILTGVLPGLTKLAPSEASAPQPARSLLHRLMAVAAGTHGPSPGEGLAGLQKGSDQGTQESGGLGLPPPHRHGHLGGSELSSPQSTVLWDAGRTQQTQRWEEAVSSRLPGALHAGRSSRPLPATLAGAGVWDQSSGGERPSKRVQKRTVW